MGSRKSSKILVADSSHTIRTLMRGFLKSKFEVIEAESGEEILSIVAEHHNCDSHCVEEEGSGGNGKHLPELNDSCDLKDLSMVILSLEFADQNAFAITKKLRAKYHKNCLPIIFSTSSNKREIIIEALKSGINDFIVKPFPKELLLSKIAKLEKEIPLHDIELSKMIASIPFFHGVPESQVAYILHTLSETITRDKGETVCDEGEDNNDLFILMEGKCNVLVENRKVAEIKPVETIGEMGFMEHTKRSATVIAAEKSKLVVIQNKPFDEYLNEERAILEIILKNIIYSLNQRIMKSNNMIQKLKIFAEEFSS